ncbi:MAG: LysM peptidoglycan-binding domain-containing protein [Chloroflexota bacterium]|nr:LysM peptidoglycan-binding domain-containing protein [Chloroflexota bacterium]MDE2895871.1 LysM peptidoglycan-binding domain-containing protein [Chloroflexota bacterium]
MRIDLKPAAAAAAAAFLLLLLFHLTWPGPGIWLLVVGLLIGVAAAYVWWRSRDASNSRGQLTGNSAPFADVGAYGLTGAGLQSARRDTSGVPLAGVLAPVSALAILLFAGGAIGSSESTVNGQPTVLEQNVSAIDRSADSELPTPRVAPPSTRQILQTEATTTPNASSQQHSSTDAERDAAETQQSAAPVKPIVVAAPKAASPADDQAESVALAPESANTFEYVVEEGDTLYDIAVRYDSTVDAIMSLNQLDAYSFIHPGDVLLIPLGSEESEGEES